MIPFRKGNALLFVACGATIVLNAVAACSSSSSEDEETEGPGTKRDASTSKNEGDDGSSGDPCAVPDAGVGEVCAKNEDCTCGNTCSALRCVPKSRCDQALLSWNAPTENQDGTCLTDLAGFMVRWGLEAGGPHPNEVDAGLPCVTSSIVPCGDGGSVPQLVCSHRIVGLDAGLWYFSVSAYNEAGVESPPAVEASKNVACP